MGDKPTIDALDENYPKLLEATKGSHEKLIAQIEQDKADQKLEKRIEELQEEINMIQKFLADDGYNKKLQEEKQKLQAIDEKIKAGGLTLKGKPTLVDFCAAWCGPCRYIAQTVHELRDKHKDTLNVVQIDTETPVGDELYRSFALPFDVNAIPFLVVFDKDGNISDKLVGADPEKLTEMVEAVLKQ